MLYNFSYNRKNTIFAKQNHYKKEKKKYVSRKNNGKNKASVIKNFCFSET